MFTWSSLRTGQIYAYRMDLCKPQDESRRHIITYISHSLSKDEDDRILPMPPLPTLPFPIPVKVGSPVAFIGVVGIREALFVFPEAILV